MKIKSISWKTDNPYYKTWKTLATSRAILIHTLENNNVLKMKNQLVLKRPEHSLWKTPGSNIMNDEKPKQPMLRTEYQNTRKIQYPDLWNPKGKRSRRQTRIVKPNHENSEANQKIAAPVLPKPMKTKTNPMSWILKPFHLSYWKCRSHLSGFMKNSRKGERSLKGRFFWKLFTQL